MQTYKNPLVVGDRVFDNLDDAIAATESDIHARLVHLDNVARSQGRCAHYSNDYCPHKNR